MRTRLVVVAVVFLFVGVLVGPVAATTPDDDGNHKVTICHVTNSDTNQFVLIEVDVAAFDGGGANDHRHHESKDGRIDFEVMDGDCSGSGGPT